MSTGVIAHYRLRERLGSGGRGEVYKAEDLKLRRTVVLKLPGPGLSADRLAGRDFLNEARAAASLHSPHISIIHEVGEDDHRPFIVMEYVEGETLAKRIERGPIEIDAAVDIAVQIVQGLCDAHTAGIIHRDLKSSNIMITPARCVKILDFGLASHTSDISGCEGPTAGTAGYMSPEQIRAEPLDPRTDIFSFGVVLYEMVAGCRPFDGASPADVFQNTLHAVPKPLRLFRDDAPLELESIVRKSLGKKRDERYASTGELLADLRSLSSALHRSGELRERDRVQPINHLPRVEDSPNGRKRRGLWNGLMLRFGDKDETSYSLPQGAAFRGLLSFQEADHDRFYGRELDTISLFERITHQEFHFGVLYGDSGCGKTSLLKAGLIPKLWESGYLPVYCRSHTDPLVTLVEECQRATRIRRKPEEDLTEYLRRVSKEMDASLVLIWDQFEEFFIHFRSRNERDSFIEFVGACCCEVNLPVKFLLSMRADFLHLVNSEMGTRIRDPLLSSRLYQLRNFDRQQASRIIDLSARRADLPFEKGLSDEVARDLAVGGAVLPSELQIVGEQLQNKRIFTPRDYRRAGGKEPLAQSYLEDVIQGSGEPQKARLLLRSLISDENTRLTLSLDEIARRMQHGRETAARLVDHFARARIINQLQDVEPWRYELMHEYLVEKINQITGMLLDATHRANRLFRQYLSNYAMDKGTRIPLGRLWSIHRHSDMDRGKTQAELIRKSFRAGLIRWGALAMLFAVGSILVAAALSITEEWEETRLGDGHVGPARQIAFSPDGSRLVSCGEDGSVIVWDFARRVRLATFNENIGQVTAVAFSNDGRWIAAGGSTGAVIVWDGSTHKRVCVLGEHPNPIGTLAFSPDSHLLLTTEGNYRTVVWETGSWKKLNDLPFGSPFGNLLFVTNRVVMECRGQAWDLETGGRANIRCQDKILHTSAALSPDRKHLATIDASGVVAFWNWGTCTPEVQATVHKDHGRAVAWSPDGNWVATGAENIVFWDAAARAQLARLESPADVWSLAFSPDSHWLVSSHGDGSILVWDAVKRELVGDLKAHSGPVSAVSFSPDGRRLASAGVDGTIIVWDTGRGTKEDVFVEENARINSLAFSPDGKSIASCAQSGIVSLWDIHDRRPRWIVESHDQWNLYCVAIAPDGRSVALDHDVLTCGDGKRVADLTTRLGPGAIYGLSFAPDGRLLACACPAAARLTLLGTADWQVVDYQKADRILQQLRVVSFSPDGQWLVTGDNNGAVRLWQAKPLRQVALIGRHKDRVKSVAFSADGRRIVSASDDKTIAIWDVKGRKLITQIGSHAAPVSSIALSIDGRIASGEWDNSVRIYNRHRVLWGRRLRVP